MDNTLVFRAVVKAIQKTNQDLNLPSPKNSQLHWKTTGRPKDGHMKKATEIVEKIAKLQQFLQTNKAAYLNVLSYLSTHKRMSDEDRHSFDSTAEEVLNKCAHLISEYSQDLATVRMAQQREEHYRNVIEWLKTYLKQVGKIYAETRAVRVKRVVDSYKLSKLKSTKETINNSPSVEAPIQSYKANNTYLYDEFYGKIDENNRIIEEEQLSTEEMKVFELENQQLYGDLNALTDEVSQMENKVVHITELQALFAEKVLQQDHDIDRISNTVVGATGNVQAANEQIRKTIQRNAGLRVWVLFFFLVFSFSLLFLDWYND